MQYETKTHKIHTNKQKQIYAQQSRHTVTKPNPENCKNCSSTCAQSKQINVTQVKCVCNSVSKEVSVFKQQSLQTKLSQRWKWSESAM